MELYSIGFFVFGCVLFLESGEYYPKPRSRKLFEIALVCHV